MDIEPKHKTAAVTICASNFFARALVLRESYLEHHPASDFYIVIVDRKHARFDSAESGVRILWAEDIGIEGFLRYAFKFDVIELCTNVKPVVLKALLLHYDQVLYLDPDICVYAELQPVFDGLASRSIVVTPHALTPVMDGKIPSDLDFLRFGGFNLGFVGVSKCEEAFEFLGWWSQRCLNHGYYEPQLGLAVDQKWMDLCPAFFPGLRILRNPGLNVAFWNLHERTIFNHAGSWFVNNDSRLYFFHFSSFVSRNPRTIAQKQSRFPVGSRPDLHELLDSYAQKILIAKDELYSSEPYSFDYFEDGLYISPTLRRFYAALERKFSHEQNPFSARSAFQRFAVSRGLARKSYRPFPRPNFKDLGTYSFAARSISLILRCILRVVGPNSYFNLMRYLAYISSIRNQAELFPRAGADSTTFEKHWDQTLAAPQLNERAPE